MEQLEENLRIYHQEHILKVLEKCDDEQKNKLLNQLKTIDFKQIKSLIFN